jgi:hypothetical protein
MHEDHSPDDGMVAMGGATLAASNADEICLEPLADGPCMNRKSP